MVPPSVQTHRFALGQMQTPDVSVQEITFAQEYAAVANVEQVWARNVGKNGKKKGFTVREWEE